MHASLERAQALPEDGRLVACERDEGPLQLARQAWRKAGVAHKVQLLPFLYALHFYTYGDLHMQMCMQELWTMLDMSVP